MAEPTNRDFFESLNKDLATGLEKALEKGFAKGTMKLSHITADQIGRSVGRQISQVLAKNQQMGSGGGGGGEGSAGKGGALANVAKLAKGFVNIAGRLVRQNAIHLRQFGDSLARTAVATQRSDILSRDNISLEFGQWHQDLSEVGKTMAASLGANVKSVDKSTQKLLARSLGLGTSMGTLSKFMATATNVIGLSTSETHSLGTEIQNLGLTNNILANSVFEAATQFAAASKGFQLLDDSHIRGLMGFVGGLEAKETGMNVGSLVARIMDLDPRQQMKLATAAQLGGGSVNRAELLSDPETFIAKAIVSLGAASNRARGQDPLAAGVLQKQLKSLGFSLDMQFAAAKLAEGRSVEDVLRLGKAGPVDTDQELQQGIQGASETAMIAMKNFAIEIEGLSTHQAFLSTASMAVEKQFYKLEDGVAKATTALAKTAGAAAGIEATIQSMNQATGGVGSKELLFGATAVGIALRKPIVAGAVAGTKAINSAVTPRGAGALAMLKEGQIPKDFKITSPTSGKQILVRGAAFKNLLASHDKKVVQQTLANLTQSLKGAGIQVGTTAFGKILSSLKVAGPALAIIGSVLDFNARVESGQTQLRAGVGTGAALVGGAGGAIGGALATKAALIAASKALAVAPIPGSRIAAAVTLIGAGIAAWFASDVVEDVALDVHDWLIPPETQEIKEAEKEQANLDKEESVKLEESKVDIAKQQLAQLEILNKRLPPALGAPTQTPGQNKINTWQTNA